MTAQRDPRPFMPQPSTEFRRVRFAGPHNSTINAEVAVYQVGETMPGLWVAFAVAPCGCTVYRNEAGHFSLAHDTGCTS